MLLLPLDGNYVLFVFITKISLIHNFNFILSSISHVLWTLSYFSYYITGYAYHVEASSGYKIIKDTFGEKEICELGQVEMVIPRRVMGQMLQKGSPLKEFVRYGHVLQY